MVPTWFSRSALLGSFSTAPITALSACGHFFHVVQRRHLLLLSHAGWGSCGTAHRWRCFRRRRLAGGTAQEISNHQPDQQADRSHRIRLGRFTERGTRLVASVVHDVFHPLRSGASQGPRSAQRALLCKAHRLPSTPMLQTVIGRSASATVAARREARPPTGLCPECPV